MRKTPKIVALATLVVAAVIVALLMAFGDQFKSAVLAKEADPVSEDRTIIYWAHGNLDPDDNIPQKGSENYFGWDRYDGANDAVDAGEAETVVDWIATKDGEGDFFYSMSVDPALTAAAALYLDQLGLTGNEPILAEEADLLVGERADAAHRRFLENPDDWDVALTRIKAILCGSDVTIEVKELNSYTSAMYMIPLQLDGDKPCVVVRNTVNAGGHFIVFNVKLKDGSIVPVRFRLECGYQPIDVPDWPTPPPVTPPEDDGKDPNDDPQRNPEAPNYDFYSPDNRNNNPDTTVTDEPVSPDQDYVAPSRPDDNVTPPSDDASSGTDSGSQTVDEDNGTQEEHDGQNYDVEAGDGEDHGNLTDIADPSNPDKPDVDPALQGDGTNNTPVTDFE